MGKGLKDDWKTSEATSLAVKKLVRKKVFSQPSNRFRIQKKNYSNQYFSLYNRRLDKMRVILQDRIQKELDKSDSQVTLEQIQGLTEQKSCIVIGTLYKEMPLKPTVLSEYAKDRALVPQPPRESFVSDKDTLFLEDEKGRISLAGLSMQGLFNPQSHITGMVVALKGMLREGEFEVEEEYLPGIPPQKERDKGKMEDNNNTFVALVSGLNMSLSSSTSHTITLLQQFLLGLVGSKQENQFQSNIARVIIAGNSFCEEHTDLLSISSNRSYRGKLADKEREKEREKEKEKLKEVEDVLTRLASTVAVDVMPGPTDPSNYNLPQQSFPPCLFPIPSQYSTYTSVTNPYLTEINDVTFLGTSGQTINSMSKYIQVKSVVELMEKTLHWRHLAPSAPDTLGCFPFYDDDPFLLDACPHVYFVGNQDKFETKLVRGPEGQTVRLISVPSFSTTSSIVLLNLADLECHLVTFDSLSSHLGR
eukprot:TRINITY_DN3772_c0_g1_i1.p1 TRINITY_DN3772_c0_g1~~TRINITY_DN3772_c0_g1_i1.p1  ORF type:complete len:490 (+),score=116.51 TRINITY_DN3772_c0_g1_i1:43-1470(+)